LLRNILSNRKIDSIHSRNIAKYPNVEVPMTEIAYLNGKILPIDQATVPVEDRGYQFGDAVYEYLATYNGRIFAMAAHLERLQNSLKALNFQSVSMDLIAKASQRPSNDLKSSGQASTCKFPVASLRAITQIDGQTIGQGRPGPVSKKLYSLLLAETCRSGTPLI
jgi:branched-subunit amino acid aminotransferase/4-amino-4-deoxychorismate lyase